MTNTNPARASEITLIGPGGIRAAGQELVTAFEKATGHKVTATFGSGGGTKERVIRGEPFDVPIVQLPLEPVIASGHVVAASETWLANVAVGLAVRSGAPKPDISNADAVKRLLLGAKAIAYPNAATGAGAGISFNATLQKLGIAEVMQPKIKIAQGGRGAMELLAKGEVDFGLTYISEIITEPGVESSARCRAIFRRPRRSWVFSRRTQKIAKPPRRCCATCPRPRLPRCTNSAACNRVGELPQPIGIFAASL